MPDGNWGFNMERDYYAEEIEPDYYTEEILKQTPHPENFLQRAIKNSRIVNFGGTSITAALPTSGEEAMDLGKVGIRQIIPESPGMVGFGAQMVDKRPGGVSLPAPETQYGKNMENSANIAQGLHLGGAMVPAIGKGIKNIIKPFQSAPVKRGIEDLIFQGSNKVKSGVDDLFKSYNAEFGQKLDALESSMTTDDFADIVTKTADEIGEFEPTRNVLLTHLENIIKNSSRNMSARQVQSAMKSMIRSAGDNRAKAILHKNFLEKIPESVPGLKELKASHAPVYEAAKGAKTLGKGLMRKVASGKIGPEELASAKEAQSRLGLDVLGPIEKEGNKLQQIIRNKKIAQAIGALTGVGGGAFTIVNALKKD